MQPGFLAGQRAAKAARRGQAAAPAGAGAAPPLTQAAELQQSAQPAPGAGQQQEPLHLDATQWEANFQQCLQLLGTPQDETRFVGLLLATKLLPQGGERALRRIFDALGWTFLQRLLLPLALSEPAGSPAPPQAVRQQQQLTAGVGLSLLSALCRLPEVATGPELQAQAPALASLLARGWPPGDETGCSADPCVDWPAAESAAECIHAAWAAHEGRPPFAHDVTQAAVAACAARLERLLTHTGVHRWHPSAAHVTNPWRLPVLAVRVVRMAAERGDDGVAPETGWRLLATLSQLLGLQEVLGAGAAAAAATAAQRAATETSARDLAAAAAAASSSKAAGAVVAQAGPGMDVDMDVGAASLVPAEPDLAALPAPTVAPAPGPTEDAALLQLESLHVLAALLPQLLGQWRSGPPPQARAAVASHREGWGQAAWRGLGWVLRSRAGPAQRHAALAVISGLFDLLGPDWLLPPARSSDGSDAAEQQQRLSALAETLQVELGLVLRDAMHRSGRHAQRRVAQLLPPVLSCLEHLIELLARQAEPDWSGEEEDDDIGGDGSGRAELAPLPLAVQQALMGALTAAVRLVVDFFGSVRDDSAVAAMDREDGMQDGSSGQVQRPQPDVLLACTRLVGRYLAEAPEAVDAALVAGLPAMLLVNAKMDSDEMELTTPLQDLAVEFLLPGLVQAVGADAAVREAVARQPLVIAALARSAGRAAAAATAAETVAETAEEGERRLTDVCRLLLRVFGPVGGTGLTPQQRSVVTELRHLVGPLSAWALARLPALCETLAQERSSTAQVVLQRLSQDLRGVDPSTVLFTGACVAAIMAGADLDIKGGGIATSLPGLCLLAGAAVWLGAVLCAVADEGADAGDAAFLAQAYPQAVRMALLEFQELGGGGGDGEAAWDTTCTLCAECVLRLPSLAKTLLGLQDTAGTLPRLPSLRALSWDVEKSHEGLSVPPTAVALRLLMSRLSTFPAAV